MAALNRREMLRVGGVVGAVGALSVTGQTTPWTWSPAQSIPGAGVGADPRVVWDPDADSVIAALIERGQVAKVNRILRSWTTNAQPLPVGLPADLRDFIENARIMPTWADEAKLAAAVRFNEKRGTYLGLIYGFASGMMSTVIPQEARAVYYSKGGADLKDRISKTAKLGYDVGARNAYAANGEMVVTCVKTRMVHAAVRYLLPKSPWWQNSAPERIPISQADVMVTWHSLATTVMRYLGEWDVPVPADESEGFLHSWQISASMLGVDDEYIPASWAGAEAQAVQVLDPILAPTPEGIKLAHMLLDLGRNLDLTVLSRPVLGALTRFMLGGRIADDLRIPPEPYWEALFDVSWKPYVAVREGLLEAGVPREVYWTFDEILRQFALWYLSELRMPISIEIPDFNNPKYS